MKYWNLLANLFSKAFYPIKSNAVFFVFMYVLGALCEILTLPPKGELYDNLWLELFFDVYVFCLVLSVIPLKVRRWIRGILYFLAYTITICDVYCFTFYDSTLNPSMLMLIGETDSREAGEFLTTILTSGVIFSKVGIILLIILLHLLVVFLPRLQRYFKYPWKDFYFASLIRSSIVVVRSEPWFGLAAIVLFIWSFCSSLHNKSAFAKLMSGTTIGEVEHTLTASDHAVLFTPEYRLVFSIYANELASQQVDKLVAATSHVRVDSCSYTSPTIVLIIGESYGKHHSQQYGYFMPTTPRQIALEKKGYLTKFSDVVTCWNLTSFVFKNMFSLHVVGEKGEWCDYPLFPQLFRKAGYHVTFLTNQFLPKAKEAVYDFSGGFFLNNPQLSKSQFDTRNDQLYQYDDGLLACYDEMKKNGTLQFAGQKGVEGTPANLVIFHLLGQHVTYKTRYPKNQTKFWASSYEEERADLGNHKRKILSQYDNACLYNDSIVAQIVKRFENQDAIVVYVPDHGEECYEGDRNFICRNHSSDIDYDLAHYEFEVPFWIYCSPKYAHKRPEIFREIKRARDRRFMTDALPHMMLYLAGIHARDYQAKYNLLSPDYDESRPRILKNQTDYDKLREQALKK